MEEYSATFCLSSYFFSDPDSYRFPVSNLSDDFDKKLTTVIACSTALNLEFPPPPINRLSEQQWSVLFTQDSMWSVILTIITWLWHRSIEYCCTVSLDSFIRDVCEPTYLVVIWWCFYFIYRDTSAEFQYWLKVFIVFVTVETLANWTCCQ